jgi:hypothetical protein
MKVDAQAKQQLQTNPAPASQIHAGRPRRRVGELKRASSPHV